MYAFENLKRSVVTELGDELVPCNIAKKSNNSIQSDNVYVVWCQHGTYFHHGISIKLFRLL